MVVTAKYTTFAKYGQSKRFLSPYAMLPSVSNIDIAKSKRPTHELDHCCCLLNSEKVKRETIFGAYIVMHIASPLKLESVLYHYKV